MNNPHDRMWRFRIAALGVALIAPSLGVTAEPPGAQILSQNPQGPDLGRIAQPPLTPSVWRIDPDTGDVSLMSGSGMRLESGPTFPPQISIQCAVQACRNATVTAIFTPSTAGAASIVGFIPGRVSSNGLTLQGSTGVGTTNLVMTFTAGPDIPATATFPLGMIVRVVSGQGAAANYGYNLSVTTR